MDGSIAAIVALIAGLFALGATLYFYPRWRSFLHRRQRSWRRRR